MTVPGFVMRWRRRYERLPYRWRLPLAWVLATVGIFLALALLKVVGVTDSWAIVALLTTAYGVGLAVVGRLVFLHARRKRHTSREGPLSS